MSAYVVRVHRERSDNSPDLYGLWSDTEKGPVTALAPLEIFKELHGTYYAPYTFLNGEPHRTDVPIDFFKSRIQRANENETSATHKDLDELLDNNKWGVPKFKALDFWLRMSPDWSDEFDEFADEIPEDDIHNLSTNEELKGMEKHMTVNVDFQKKRYVIAQIDGLKYVLDLEENEVVATATPDVRIYDTYIGGEPPVFPERKIVQDDILGHPTTEKKLQSAIQYLHNNPESYA